MTIRLRSWLTAAQQAEQEHKESGGLLGFLGLGQSDTATQTGGKPQEGGIDAMIQNPLVKVAIAGVAAMAAKKLTEPRG